MSSGGVLHVVGGNDRGNRYDLNRPETRIGRGADQDVVLSDIAVSRRHITVHAEGSAFRLRDLGSGNGTLVNGQRIDTVILNHGDHIELGNTVMRFEQPGVQAGAPPPYAPPPAAAPPPSYTPPPASAPPHNATFAPTPSPVHHATVGLGHATQAPMPAPAPISAPAPMPAPAPRGAAMPLQTGRRVSRGGPLDTPLKKALVFGAMGLASAGGLGVIVSRTVFAKPVVVQSEAEELYRQGVRLFASADYEGSKVAFTEALVQAPDAPEPKRYADRCDIEMRTKSALRVAERTLASHRYAAALAALDGADVTSVAYDQVERLRRDNGPRAAAELLEEARSAAQSDPAGARRKLTTALKLDPANDDARALAAKLGAAVPSAPVAVAAAAPPRAAAIEPPSSHHHATKEAEIPLVKAPPTPKPGKEPKDASSGAVAGLNELKSAGAPYKARDFATAEKNCRLEALQQSPKLADKSLALANQIRSLKQAHDRANSEEARNPDEAVKDYNEAMALDAKLGHGVHAAYFKQKIGKVELAAAQQAFQQGRYDAAYQAVAMAQKLGAGDGGMPKQLETRAGELIQKGISVQKTNVNQAKNLFRMVIKMVPVGSPTYAKAYSLLNNAGAAHRDEDEE